MKSYTDIEQSKKLAEILPIESADACWTNHLFDSILSSWRVESTPPQKYKSLLDRFVVRGYLIEPAWSLVGLLDVLPFPQLFKDKLGGGKVRWMVSVYPDNCRHDSCWHDNPVDACVGMIIKLKELNSL